MYNGKFIIHIAGPGKCGKDTVAQAISDITGLGYKHSTSYGAAPFFYQAVLNGELEHEELDKHTYRDLEECYQARNESQYMRTVWARFIDKMNERTGTELYKLCIENGNNILTGIRKKREMQACIDQGIIDLNVWICNSMRTQNEDCTQEYGPELCDFILLNDRRESGEHAKINVKNNLHRILSAFAYLSTKRT